jgi:hypothetical protein
MSFNRKFYALFLACLMALTTSIAQDRDFIPDEGEVVEGEFVISKELEISLPAAQRLFQKVPPDELEKRESEPIQYSFRDYTPELSDIPTKLRVLKLKDTKITQGPSSYLTVGFGNFLTPLFQLGINSGANIRSNIGLNISHLSSMNGPVDKKNSGDSQTKIGLFGKYIGSSASISGDVGYNRLGNNFYGYDDGIEVDKDTIGQHFNDFHLALNIKNASVRSPLQYQIFGRAYHVSDKFDASEFGFKGGVGMDYEVAGTMRAGLLLEYVFGAYKNPESINRSLVRIHPNFVYTNEVLSIDAGFRVLYYNDTLNNANSTSISPVIKVDYSISDDLTAYAHLDGDVEEVTYKSLIYDNPYVNSMLPLNHSRKPLDLRVGVKGKAMQFLAYNAGVRAAFYKNMYFYINDPDEFNKFTMIYDEGTTSLYQFYTSLSYMRSKVLGSTLSLKLNTYDVSDVAKAWHKPGFELDYSIWYNIYDKVKLSADIFILSGIQGVDRRFSTQQSVNLDPAADLNLKIDYKLSDRYSAFVSVNNILNRNYELYYRYPTRGLLAMAGVSISF